MPFSFKSTGRFLIVLAAVLGLAGCSTSNPILVDYDRSMDFGSYKTWNFFADAGPDYEGYESLFTQYMMEAITLEMDKRGYKKSDNPDLLVNFNVNLQDKTKVRQTSSPSYGGYGGYYGYRGGYYDPWGGYGYNTQTHVSQYTEGTFNIDLVDARRKQLVWEAVGVGRVSQKKLENLEAGVKKGVPNFFSNYPFVAGSATPVQTD